MFQVLTVTVKIIVVMNCGTTLCSSGEERPADTECPGGQAVEGSQRSAEGAGRSGDGAGSHTAQDEPDPPQSEKPH